MGESGTAKKRIAIIGAGCSGLVSIKTCKEDGLEPVCFEMSQDIGGLWNYSDRLPEPDTLNASVYKTCCINTSKEMMCFSDFPMPKDFPPFMPHKKVLEYFRMYTDNFDLKPHIKFGTKVINIKPAESHADTGAWTVVTRCAGDSESIKEETFDGVMVCTGHHRFPYLPEIDGAEKFQGTVIHSSQYKTADMFKDKKVLVLGIGNSGADIATDASYVADEVNLSTEKGSWIISRFFPGGFPADALANSRFMQSIPRYALQWMVELMAQFKYSAEHYGLKCKHRGLEAHPTIHDFITIRIMSGLIKIRPGVDHFDYKGVYFTDGSYEECDVVVLATGYEYKFPFLDKKILHGNSSSESIDAYKYTFLPHLEYPETLCMVGLVQAIGAIMPISELQARWFTRVMQGKQKLPTIAAMYDYVDNKKKGIAKNYVHSRRHDNLETFWVPAMDELAEEIGAKPNMMQLAKEDPMLALRCFFGPCVPAQYRIHGPGNWPGAKHVIENCITNVVHSTQTRRITTPNQKFKWSAVSDKLVSLRILLYMLTFVFVAMMLVDLRLIG